MGRRRRNGSTLTPAEVAPTELIIGRGLGFIDQARLQLVAVERATVRFQERFINSGVFAQYRTEREEIDDAEYDRARRAPRLRERDGWRAVSERHLALITLAQVEKVAAKILAGSRPTYPGANPVRALRDVEEHWEKEGHSLRELRKRDPRARPGVFSFGGGGVLVGDATIEDVRDWLDETEQALRAHPASAGIPRPDHLVPFTY